MLRYYFSLISKNPFDVTRNTTNNRLLIEQKKTYYIININGFYEWLISAKILVTTITKRLVFYKKCITLKNIKIKIMWFKFLNKTD